MFTVWFRINDHFEMRKNIFLKVRLRSLEKKLFWSTLTGLVHCKVNNRKVANESLMDWKKPFSWFNQFQLLQCDYAFHL